MIHNFTYAVLNPGVRFAGIYPGLFLLPTPIPLAFYETARGVVRLGDDSGFQPGADGLEAPVAGGDLAADVVDRLLAEVLQGFDASQQRERRPVVGHLRQRLRERSMRGCPVAREIG